jgi:oxygen-independent coproporphyrinogen III oxidase
LIAPGDAADAGAAPVGVYVHVPFCARRCPYCDFNTQAGRDEIHLAYVRAVEREADSWCRALAGRTVTTLYVGGGTPTVLAADLLTGLFAGIRASLRVAPGAEITCEANPGTVDGERFGALRDAGVNRLSMGAQSLDPVELAWLGRIHDASDVARAFHAARSAGFDQISLDLMFGLPGQSARTWARSLDGAIALGPDHLSLYGLTVEPGTPLGERVASGRQAAPDDDAAADRYEEAMALLAAAGYHHYEVSNWALATPGDDEGGTTPGRRAARHNLRYWRNGEYVGLGAGAHSHLRSAGPGLPESAARWSNVRSPDEYIARIVAGVPVVDARESIDPRTDMGETMMLGLRLVREGVPHARFQALHGTDPRAVFGPELRELADRGLVEVDDVRTRLTRRGLMLGNQVFASFLGED